MFAFKTEIELDIFLRLDLYLSEFSKSEAEKILTEFMTNKNLSKLIKENRFNIKNFFSIKSNANISELDLIDYLRNIMKRKLIFIHLTLLNRFETLDIYLKYFRGMREVELKTGIKVIEHLIANHSIVHKLVEQDRKSVV